VSYEREHAAYNCGLGPPKCFIVIPSFFCPSLRIMSVSILLFTVSVRCLQGCNNRALSYGVHKSQQRLIGIIDG